MLGGRPSLPKAVLKRKRVMQSCPRQKKVLLNRYRRKPVDALRTARPIWQDARKTSRRAQRLRGSLPSGCHGRPRPALPETRTRLAFAESRAADSPHAICDGSNRTQVPGDITCTSPHAKHRRYGPLRSRPRRSRPASALPSKFRRRRRRPGRGSDGPQRAATRPVRSASVR